MRATRVRVIAFREWRESVGNKSFIFVTLFVPAIMVAMTLLPQWLSGRSPSSSVPPAAELAENRYLTALLLIVFLFLGVTTQSQAMLRSVMEERANRVMEVILSSVRPIELLAGKLAGYAAVAVTQFALWVLTALVLSSYIGLPALLRVMAAAGWRLGVLFIACYTIGYLTYASLYMLIGTLISGERDANLYQQLFALVLVAPFVITLSLVGTIATNPDDPTVVHLTWTPLFTPTVLLLRAALGSVSAATVVGSLAVSMLAAIAILVLSARVFNAPLLLKRR